MTKIYDIAAKAKVSPSTVSNVLNGKKNVGEQTRKKVLELCEKYDYQPNLVGKALKTKTNRTILFNFSDFDRKFYLEIIHGISDYVYSKNYDLLICTNRNNQRYMNKGFTCGCITLDIQTTNDLIIKKAQSGYPIIVLDRMIEEENIKSILVNNHNPQKEIVETLINKGCKEFAFLGGLESLDTNERYEALVNTLKEHQLSIRRENIFQGDYREKSGYQTAKLLLLTEKLPDALICANDDMAIGAIKAFKENNISIPEQISITGFDDTETAKPFGLTTVQIPNYERGYIAAQYLIECIEGNANFEPFKISAKVKWRQSTR